MESISHCTSNFSNSRRRPYSHTSSIKSIIHGPNIEDIEQELRKLEIEQEKAYSARLHPSDSKKVTGAQPNRDNVNSASRRSSVSNYNALNNLNLNSPCRDEPEIVFPAKSKKPRGSSAASSLIITTNRDSVDNVSLPQFKRRRHERPKTCAASFPNRGSEVKQERPVRSISRSSSAVYVNKLREPAPKVASLVSVEADEGICENMASRHQWAVRGEALNNWRSPEKNEVQVPKRRLKQRISASAPPRSSSLKHSVSLSHLVGPRSHSARAVEAFTPASRMSNTYVIAPKRLKVFEPRPSPPTTFRRMYERGDIPVTLQHDHRGQSLRWKVDLGKLDYQQYLPLFFDGLRETRHPYDFFSRAGVRELLANGGDKILPLIPQLILPMKSALNTRIPGVVCTVLKVIQELLVATPGAGEALVPYYRQLLPTLNLFQHKNVNCGDEIDYSQQRRENLGDLIQETLEMLERHGGKDAYINIKYMVPTYQSCISS